jgi:putative transposase
MRQFSLEVGLVVRRGSQQLEFLNLLEGNKVQFQDQRTHFVQVMKLSTFYAEVMSKKIQPVIGNCSEETGKGGESKPSELIFDIASLGAKEQSRLERCINWVKALRKRGITRGQLGRIGKATPEIATALGDKSPPAPLTLAVWMRKYDLSCGSPAALLSGNRHRRRNRRLPSLVEEVIQKRLRSVYLTTARHTLRHAHEQILLELKKLVQAKKLEGDQACVSLATVSRRLSEFGAYERAKARYGAGYARPQFRTSVEGTLAVRAMQRLECDHALLNWVVICDRTGLPLGRPTLTIIVDAMSGYVVGLYVSFYGPGITSVLNVVKNAIQPKDDLARAAGAKQPWIAFGIGETLVLDNGMEFHARVFQLAAWELGIDLEYCRVRSPWLKPHVERFFANLDYFSLARGRIRKPEANVLQLDPKKDAAILFSDLVRGLIKFVVDVYPFELNERKLVTPFAAFQDSFNTLRPPSFQWSMDQLNLIAAMRKDLTVGPGGVCLPGISYSSSAVLAMKKEVGHTFKTGVKWNPDNLSFIYLQHPVNKDWLPVPSLRPDYTNGLSWNQHRLIRKHAREKHVRGGGVDQLLLARQELHELWMNGIARSNRSQDTRTAAKFSGLSSNQILLPDQTLAPHIPASKMLSQEDYVFPAENDIQSFETFVMRNPT